MTIVVSGGVTVMLLVLCITDNHACHLPLNFVAGQTKLA